MDLDEQAAAMPMDLVVDHDVEGEAPYECPLPRV
jgi:hypothetical protein